MSNSEEKNLIITESLVNKLIDNRINELKEKFKEKKKDCDVDLFKVFYGSVLQSNHNDSILILKKHDVYNGVIFFSDIENTISGKIAFDLQDNTYNFRSLSVDLTNMIINQCLELRTTKIECIQILDEKLNFIDKNIEYFKICEERPKIIPQTVLNYMEKKRDNIKNIDHAIIHNAYTGKIFEIYEFKNGEQIKKLKITLDHITFILENNKIITC